ncbi:MAG: redox-sensing transcriptional repressor Rex [Spirochaetales bacterium]|nr:redox-sensing transcriptional repressor Rex [Spirochaetales bacterium]
MTEIKEKISSCIMERLERYYLYIQRLSEQGQVWISSQELAEGLNLTSSTVRQDISHLNFSGISKRGYELVKLRQTLRSVLGLDTRYATVIVGAGNFGRALLLHDDFREKGFDIKAIFDNNPKLIGKRIESYYIQSIDKLTAVVKKNNVRIGVIAVPAKAAQEVADKLTAAGVNGILNLSTANVQIPQGKVIVNSHIILDFIQLAFYLNE